MGYQPPKEDVETMFKEADSNGDGKISLQEFLVCYFNIIFKNWN